MDNQDNQFFQLHYYTGLSLLTDVPYISPIKHNSTHAWVKHKDQCCVLRVSWFISMLAPKYSIKYTLFIFMMYKMYWKYAIHGMEVPPFFFFKMWVLKYQPHLPVVVYTLSRVWSFATPWTVAWQALCPAVSPRVCSNSSWERHLG